MGALRLRARRQQDLPSNAPLLGLGSVRALRVEGISRLIFSRPEVYMDMLNPIDFSPVLYLDSIMNGRHAFLTDEIIYTLICRCSAST